jgi:SAM-dependent methyltransferase
MLPNRPLHIDDLQELLWSFAAHRALTAAGRTGMLEALAVEELTADDLAARLGLDPPAAAKVLRALVALGILEATPAGHRVVRSLREAFAPGEASLVPFLDHSHDLYVRWGESLEGWLRGESWPTRRRDPDGARRFGAAMRAMASRFAGPVVRCLDLGAARRLLDVGGGTGALARACCEANPTLAAVVFDTPETAALGAAETATTPLAGRVTFAGGDYLADDLGGGFDLVLIANVLHQETPERAATLVRRCAGALAPGGRLAVIDFSLDPDGSPVGALFAINMRSFGDTHDEATIRGWLEDAGLEGFERLDPSPHRWMLQARRPA